MKFRLLAIVVAIAVGLVAKASASTEYYLVGLRHVYMFDVWPDPYKADRQSIEETYSGALLTAQQQYDTDMTSIRSEEAQDNGFIHQVDRDAVQQNLEQDIADAADSRDDGLSQMYVQCDYVRETHPELQVDQDGPYQVISLEVDDDGEFVQITFYRPYHTYLEPCPFGWIYGHGYPYFSYGMQLRMARARWKMFGSPAFSPIYHAGVKISLLAPVRLDVIASRKTWEGGRPPAISDEDRKVMQTQRNLQRQAGIRPPSAHPGQLRRVMPHLGVATSRFSRKPSPSRQADPASPYNHPPSRPVGDRSTGGEPARSRGNGGGGNSQHPPAKGESHGSSGSKGSGGSTGEKGGSNENQGDKKKGG